MAKTPSELILASGSPIRARLLKEAGVEFRIQSTAIDESAIKDAGRAVSKSAGECALALAEAKARAVARGNPTAIVLGADQILDTGNGWFDKPIDLAQARTQLLQLRGRAHELATAACMIFDDSVVWHALSVPRLRMRDFSEIFLETYLAAEGDAVLGSVGCYRLEGRGVQLFSKIDGDYFAILGLPLIEILEFLRGHGLIGK